MKTRVVWLTALLVAGCNLQLGGLGSPNPTSSPKPTGSPTPTGSIAPLADDAVVFSWEFEGGRCPQTVCYNARSFRVDGRFEAVDGPDTGKRSGKIDPALVLALRREIAKADFKALRLALDADTRCKRVFDGGDETWVFTTGNGKETFKACSIIVKDVAVFEAASKLLAAAGDALMAERSPTPVSATSVPTPSPGATVTPTKPPTPGTTAPPSVAPTSPPSSQPSARVVVIGRYGGLCPAGVTCGQETAFQRDGRYVTTSGAKELGAGKVEGTLVDALVAEIAKADFAALKAKPFTGTCPTAFDGQETTYTFMTLAGVEKLPACQYDLPLDHPLFKATQALENARQEQLE